MIPSKSAQSTSLPKERVMTQNMILTTLMTTQLHIFLRQFFAAISYFSKREKIVIYYVGNQKLNSEQYSLDYQPLIHLTSLESMESTMYAARAALENLPVNGGTQNQWHQFHLRAHTYSLRKQKRKSAIIG